MGPVAPDWREGRGPQGPSRAGAVSRRRVRSCWAPKPAAASCYVWLRQTQTPGPQGGHSWPRPGRRWLGEADRRGADGGRVPSSPSLGVPRGQSPRRGCWSGSGAAGAWPGWTERRWGSRLPLSVRTRKPQLRAAAGLPGRPRAVRDGGRKLTFHGLEHSICTRSLDPGAERVAPRKLAPGLLCPRASGQTEEDRHGKPRGSRPDRRAGRATPGDDVTSLGSGSALGTGAPAFRAGWPEPAQPWPLRAASDAQRPPRVWAATPNS